MAERLQLGIHLMTYGATWPEIARLAQEADRLGYDFLLMHDHLLATQGDLHQPFFEAYTTLGSFAMLTERVRLGLMTGNNPLRNPGVVAKMMATLDHISKGRMVLCLGAGSWPVELPVHGLGDESVGRRLDALDESLSIVTRILAGEEVTFDSEHYHFDGARHAPQPIQQRIPVFVGATGERKGLRIVAKHADYWQMTIGPAGLDEFRHKQEVLAAHCSDLGRDPATIVNIPSGNFILRANESAVEPAFVQHAGHFRWTPEVRAEVRVGTWGGTSDQVAERLAPFRKAGIRGLIAQQLPPFDYESLERLATEVAPALAQA